VLLHLLVMKHCALYVGAAEPSGPLPPNIAHGRSGLCFSPPIICLQYEKSVDMHHVAVMYKYEANSICKVYVAALARIACFAQPIH